MYRDIFGSGELNGRAKEFLSFVKDCIPQDIPVIFVMDAAFGVEWFQVIDSYDWHWIARVKDGKKLKIDAQSEWQTVLEFCTNSSFQTKLL